MTKVSNQRLIAVIVADLSIAAAAYDSKSLVTLVKKATEDIKMLIDIDIDNYFGAFKVYQTRFEYEYANQSEQQAFEKAVSDLWHSVAVIAIQMIKDDEVEENSLVKIYALTTGLERIL